MDGWTEMLTHFSSPHRFAYVLLAASPHSDRLALSSGILASLSLSSPAPFFLNGGISPRLSAMSMLACALISRR